MMWFFIILVVAVLVVLWYRRGQGSEEDNEPVDTFVCDQCGEQECICHKEETE